jgi:hypothetical protein
MKEILISNNVGWHYEIIESVILKYDYLLNINKSYGDSIYIKLEKDDYDKNANLNYSSFVDYIKRKYPTVTILGSIDKEYEYQIHCTVSASDAKDTDAGLRPKDIINNNKYAYIAHDITDELLSFDNVYFLSTLGKNIDQRRIFKAEILPNIQYKTNTDIPIFVIQGSFVRTKYDITRTFWQLEDILSKKYEKDFRIKIIGRWHEDHFDINDFINMDRVESSNRNKIIVKLNLSWDDYHNEFLNCHGILPIINKNIQPWYFDKKITSSINYGKAYGLKFFADNDFFNTYGLNKNDGIMYKDSITDKFEQALNLFYSERNK